MQVEYLLVGQGLAGSILSYQFLQAGKEFLVIDDGNRPSSSAIAAGIFNPITGRKMVKTWLADELFPFLDSFYPQLADFLGVSCYHPLPIYRPFFSIEEQNEWMAKWDEPGYQRFIKSIQSRSYFDDKINDPYGGLEVEGGGYVDLGQLTHAMRRLLNDKSLIYNDFFDWNNIKPAEDKIRYREIEAKNVIFCDGPFFADQHYFSWLPFRPVKGEILTIKSQGLPKTIINRGVFVLPLGDEVFRVGATYDWKDLSWQPTEMAREQIEHKLGSLVNTDYQVLDQKAGVRPATADRRPLIGQHPKWNRIKIFNGFGTKGVSLMPYFAKEFCDSLFKEKEIRVEANINRYFSLY